MVAFQPYQLRSELHGHDEDVRAATAGHRSVPSSTPVVVSHLQLLDPRQLEPQITALR